MNLIGRLFGIKYAKGLIFPPRAVWSAGANKGVPPMKTMLLGSIGALALLTSSLYAQEAQEVFGESEAVGAAALSGVRGQNNPK